jgi:putative SOS response-associated peptidase YedK
MCGRAKLPTDYSEIKIRLKFDDRWPAPNLKQSWNIAPTDPMLTAVLDNESGTRRPVLMLEQRAQFVLIRFALT